FIRGRLFFLEVLMVRDAVAVVIYIFVNGCSTRLESRRIGIFHEKRLTIPMVRILRTADADNGHEFMSQFPV
ncbi:MAG: hypothetical protein WCL29_06090, partial [Pseudomonadota bacterium]